MINTQISRVIDQPQSVVWELLSDASTPVDYHFLVTKVDLLSTDNNNNNKKNAKRICHFTDGTCIHEDITQVNDHQLKIVASEFTMPMLKEMYANILVLPYEKDKNKTRVTFDVHYATYYGPFGYLMGHMMMKPMLKKVFAKVLAGVDEHLTTGKPVAKQGRSTKKWSSWVVE